MKTKKELRKEILKLRDALTLEARVDKSHIIAEKVIAHKGFIEADKVLLFAPYKSEVDTTEIFAAAQKKNKSIYYPKVVGDEMEFYQVHTQEELLEGYRGIREPEGKPQKSFRPNPTDKIFVLMPGAAFDVAGNRIGYGGGFYDKFLHRLEMEISRENVCKVAVAFACQVVDCGKVIAEEHDIRIDCLLTEKSKEYTYNSKVSCTN